MRRGPYDGVNEVAEYDGSGNKSRTYVHGISYVDERLMMRSDGTSRPYYYAIDRMYNVVMLIDRAGALVERYCYDAYGRPYIRESCGRGDMDDNTIMNSTDTSRFTAAKNATIWDPRADLDDDGDIDAADQTAYTTKSADWSGLPVTIVAQPVSDVGNPFGWQGRVHFNLDYCPDADAPVANLMLIDHRNRMHDTVTGRWLTRDPAGYRHGLNLYQYVRSNALKLWDPSGLYPEADHWAGTLNELSTLPFSEAAAQEIAKCNYDTDRFFHSALVATVVNKATFGAYGAETYAAHFPGAGPPSGPQQAVESGVVNNPVVANRVTAAILSCDKCALGEALHTLPDSYSHHGVPDNGGHTRGTSYPDAGGSSGSQRGQGIEPGPGSKPVTIFYIPMCRGGLLTSQGVWDEGVDDWRNDVGEWNDAMAETNAVLQIYLQACGPN
jgi:RHS repeat-associated protein